MPLSRRTRASCRASRRRGASCLRWPGRSRSPRRCRSTGQRRDRPLLRGASRAVRAAPAVHPAGNQPGGRRRASCGACPRRWLRRSRPTNVASLLQQAGVRSSTRAIAMAAEDLPQKLLEAAVAPRAGALGRLRAGQHRAHLHRAAGPQGSRRAPHGAQRHRRLPRQGSQERGRCAGHEGAASARRRSSTRAASPRPASSAASAPAAR